MMKITILLLFFVNSAFAKNYIEENLRKLSWNGVEVVWLEDNSLPTFDLSVYFRDGALGESKTDAGITQLMFDQLTSGTKRYTQKDIVESLEFFGTKYGSRVTHEFSTFSVHGLVKNIVPTMKMVCHLFDDASFPKKELKKAKSREIVGLESLVSQHGKLANRIFREESLKGSGFERPVSGYKSSIKRINSKKLSARLKEFNEKVFKKIYIKGPKDIKVLSSVFANDCGWKGVKGNEKSFPIVKSKAKNQNIIFVPVPNANQAQVRIGRIVSTDEIRQQERELKSFATNYLGGGFTSQLVQVLRVKKALTYSAGSYHSEQNSYGRTGMSTFTKNETIVELLKSINEVVNSSTKSISKSSFMYSKRSLKGNYLLGLESTSDFLENLMQFDHNQISYDEIYKFNERVDQIEIKDVQRMIGQLYNIEAQTILVLGNKSLIKDLKKAGYKVTTKNYKKYL